MASASAPSSQDTVAAGQTAQEQELQAAAAALEQEDNVQATLPTMEQLTELQNRLMSQTVAMQDLATMAMVLHGTLLRLQTNARALEKTYDKTSRLLEHGIERVLEHGDDGRKLAVVGAFCQLRQVTSRGQRTENMKKWFDRSQHPDKQVPGVVPPKPAWPRWLKETADRFGAWCWRGGHA